MKPEQTDELREILESLEMTVKNIYGDFSEVEAANHFEEALAAITSKYIAKSEAERMVVEAMIDELEPVVEVIGMFYEGNPPVEFNIFHERLDELRTTLKLEEE